MKQFDCIVVGQGIAGSVLAYQLMNLQKKVLVINNPMPNQSSVVAAGMFNPVSGKRMVLAWNWEKFLHELTETYQSLEQLFGESLLNFCPTIQYFGNVKEQNDFSIKAEDATFMGHLNAEPERHEGFKDELGAFEILTTGWLQSEKLIQKLRNKWQAEGVYLEEAFDYNALETLEEGFQYKNFTASKIIFCEGMGIAENPYFNYLPMVPAKGDVFVIKCKDIPQTRIWKKGIYLVPIGKGQFKAGSTYRWGNLSPAPDEAGRKELLEKLHLLLDVPFEIIAHVSGIRPASKDRMPIVGAHPQVPNMYLLNGLGTKGIMWVPYVSKQLIGKMYAKAFIEKEIDIERFNTAFQF